MNTFKGTPGIYKIDPNPATHILGLKTIEISSIRSENDLPEWIAYVRGKNNEEAFATAKLFAASKDIVKALQEMVEVWEAVELNPTSSTYLKAKAALSKALD